MWHSLAHRLADCGEAKAAADAMGRALDQMNIRSYIPKQPVRVNSARLTAPAALVPFIN